MVEGDRGSRRAAANVALSVFHRLKVKPGSDGLMKNLHYLPSYYI
jgi:hypothetical protein